MYFVIFGNARDNVRDIKLCIKNCYRIYLKKREVYEKCMKKQEQNAIMLRII